MSFLDPEGCKLGPQSLCKRFKCMFGGRIAGGVGNRYQSGDRGHEYQSPLALRDHLANDSLGKSGAPKEIDFEHFAQEIERQFANRPRLHYAGIAHEDVDVPSVYEASIPLGCYV